MAQYTNFSNGWSIQNSAAIDKRLLLTKAEMKAVSDDTASFMVPDVYFCICTEDGELYLYNVNNSNVGATGKYKKLEAQGKVKDVLVNSESVLDSEGVASIELLDWALVDEAGNSISLVVDSEYKITAVLYDKNGVILSSSQIDLPIEQLIVSVTYDNATKELVITLKNGNVTRVPIGDIVSGLATEAALNAEILRASTAEALLEDMIDSEGSRLDAIEDRLPTGTDELATKAYVDSEDNLIKAYSDAGDISLKQYVDGNFVKDVKIEGVSKTTGGVANLTTADITNAIKYRGATNRVFGLMTTNNQMWLASAKQSEIDNASLRNNLNDDDAKYRQAITQGNIDYAVKAALTDGKGPAYSAVEKEAARTRLDAQQTLVAGEGVTISGNTISATGKEYQAGANISFTGTTSNPIINAVDTTYAAGNGVDITSNVVSAKVDGDTIITNGSGQLKVNTVELSAGTGIKVHDSVIEVDTDVIPTKSFLTSDYQKKLTAGTNITIDPTTNIISATGGSGGSYVAGANIQINGNVISATDTTYNAGSGIIINGNTISATGGGSGGANWGFIGGTLSNQTDLQQALNNKANVASIPTNVSQLTNDSGYVTNTYHDATKQNLLTAGAGIGISGNTIRNKTSMSYNSATGVLTITTEA